MMNIILALRKQGYKQFFTWFVVIVGGSMIFSGLSPLLYNVMFGSGAGLTVNGITVTPQEFQLKTALESQRIDYVRQQFGPFADQLLLMYGFSNNPAVNAEKSLIVEKLLISAAQRSAINVSDAYITRRLQDPSFLASAIGPRAASMAYGKNGCIKLDVLDQILRSQRMTQDFFDQQVHGQALKDAALMATAPSFVPLNAEVKEAFIKKHAQRNYTIQSYDLAPYVKEAQATALDDAALQEFYQAHKLNYASPEKRSGILYTLSKKHAGGFSLDVDDAEFNEFIASSHARKSSIKEQVATGEGQLNKMLFSLQPGTRGTYTEGDSTYIVIPAISKESCERPYEEVVSEVTQDLYKQQALQALAQDLEQNSISGDRLSSTKTVSLTPALSADRKEALRKKEYPVDRMENMTRPASVLNWLTTQGGLKITLDSVTVPEKMDDHEQRVIAKEVQHEKEQFLQGAFIDSLRKNATIKSQTTAKIEDFSLDQEV